MPSQSLSKTGLAAGLRYFIPTLIGALVGFLGIFVIAFVSSNPTMSYILGITVGMIVGLALASTYLKRNGIPNYVLITILSACFGLVIPVFGGLISFPILTSFLGRRR
jgi:Na+/glutamate symporter